MINFELYNPTNLIFGKGQIEKLSTLVPQGAKILLAYGGGSIFKNGIHEQVINNLKGFEIVEFGGIEPNPHFETLMKAVAVIKEQNIDFILAVGGGSVIDGVKFLSAAAKYDGEPWDILQKGIRTEEGKGLPFASVLTLPATGSEMNSGSVISRRATKQKLAMGGPGLFPVFSILDPEVIRSIPKKQIANGITDAYTHVLEQYMTVKTPATLQDRFAESILQTLQEIAPKMMAEEFDYDAAANFMWSCTMALNGLIQKGVTSDWAVHMMGHELTAQFGIDHARTLAVIAPSHYRYNFEAKKEKLAQYAERVWNVTEGSLDEKANQGIEHLEKFFQSLGIATKLSDYTENYEGTAELVEKTFLDRKWLALGERGIVKPEDAKKIVEMAY